MLRFLLDEHISPAVAQGLRRHGRNLVIRSMAEWEHGEFLGQPDSLLLRAAAQQNLTLVSYDLRTIPTLLKVWAEEGRSHAGVIFVDEKTIAPDNLGGLIRALLQLTHQSGDWDWTNRVYFLRR